MAFQADLSQSKWHGMPAWCLQSDHLRVITVPATGAKITSIKDRAAGHEWLVTPHTRPFKPLTYGSNFGDHDMTGWDEMYPTIDICPYPVEGPWHGATLPDHGEVWALPWNVSNAEAGHLTLSVEGRALPYRLERTLSLVDTRTLRLDYCVTNTGPEPQAGFWTAHPQFAADDDTRILLPDDVEQVVSVHPGDLGKPGDLHPWPDTKTVSGDIKRLDRIWPAEPASSRKIYAQPDQPLSWAALKQAGRR